MDPRLNPQLNPSQPPALPAQSTAPPPQSHPAPTPVPQPHPAQAAEYPSPPAAQQPLAQLVGAIPVRQPGSQPQAVPVAAEQTSQAPSTATAAGPAKPHDDLDRILQAVNNRVATAPPQAKPKKEIVKKIADKAAKVKPANKSSRPIGLTLAVILVTLVLSFLALRAYRQTGAAASISNEPGKVGTSYTASSAIQSAGGTLVRPADLDDYSQELQTKLNSLNDGQDFAANSLSDQILGL